MLRFLKSTSHVISKCNMSVFLNRTIADIDFCFKPVCGSHLPSQSQEKLSRRLPHRLSKHQPLIST